MAASAATTQPPAPAPASAPAPAPALAAATGPATVPAPGPEATSSYAGALLNLKTDSVRPDSVDKPSQVPPKDKEPKDLKDIKDPKDGPEKGPTKPSQQRQQQQQAEEPATPVSAEETSPTDSQADITEKPKFVEAPPPKVNPWVVNRNAASVITGKENVTGAPTMSGTPAGGSVVVPPVAAPAPAAAPSAIPVATPTAAPMTAPAAAPVAAVVAPPLTLASVATPTADSANAAPVGLVKEEVAVKRTSQQSEATAVGEY